MTCQKIHDFHNFSNSCLKFYIHISECICNRIMMKKKYRFFDPFTGEAPLKEIQGRRQVEQMCALSPSALIPIENFKALFLNFLFLRFLKCCVQDKKKLNEIATPFQRNYLQFCFFLSVNQKGSSKKILNEFGR